MKAIKSRQPEQSPNLSAHTAKSSFQRVSKQVKEEPNFLNIVENYLEVSRDLSRCLGTRFASQPPRAHTATQRISAPFSALSPRNSLHHALKNGSMTEFIKPVKFLFPSQ
jgi:hypothetical protein